VQGDEDAIVGGKPGKLLLGRIEGMGIDTGFLERGEHRRPAL
jgi:hypothetical protein